MNRIDSGGYPYVWYIRPLLFLLRRKTGSLSTAVRLWGRLPGGFLGFLWMLRCLDHGRTPLPATLRALLRTRVSQIDLCAFCIDLNGSKALALGVSTEKLSALADWAHSPLYDAAERAALAFAEAITHTGGRIEAELLAGLRQHYDDDTIVELAALVAHQNLSTKFNRALGVSD
ncbi:MAG: carboxymuconolactone decarboxylase family protein [Magnetococcales bacterium]|nr:carboxymuconolactone decarboxylase family protein [Magnetococcales bacterium]